MSDKTSISWCDATFNPWWGCSKVSPACDHCYAERIANRFHDGLWEGLRRVFEDDHWEHPMRWARTMPAKLGRRPRVFALSMGDWLDLDAPLSEFVRLLDTIRLTPELDWLLLSKRIGNWRKRLSEAHKDQVSATVGDLWHWIDGWLHGIAPNNVWMGATVINQSEADRDIPKLLAVPARVRFVSIEPMLGHISLRRLQVAGGWYDSLAGWRQVRERFPGFEETLEWVIVGGESGPHARPSHPDWFRSLRDQCAAAGVPFHFKQHGEWLPTAFCDDEAAMLPSRRTVYVKPDGSYVPLGADVDFFNGAEETAWVGKAAAGRLLDGGEHNGFPA